MSKQPKHDAFGTSTHDPFADFNVVEYLQQNPDALSSSVDPKPAPAKKASNKPQASAKKAQKPTGRKAAHHSAILSAKSAIMFTLLDAPATGSEIKSRVLEQTDGKIALLSGSVYPGLEHLCEMGWVEVVRDDDGSRTYAVTALGRWEAISEVNAVLALLRRIPELNLNDQSTSPRKRRAA